MTSPSVQGSEFGLLSLLSTRFCCTTLPLLLPLLLQLRGLQETTLPLLRPQQEECLRGEDGGRFLVLLLPLVTSVGLPLTEVTDPVLAPGLALVGVLGTDDLELLLTNVGGCSAEREVSGRLPLAQPLTSTLLLLVLLLLGPAAPAAPSCRRGVFEPQATQSKHASGGGFFFAGGWLGGGTEFLRGGVRLLFPPTGSNSED